MLAFLDRRGLAEDLWSYGEDELAFRALELTELELARVGVIAGRLLRSDEQATSSGNSMLIARACALAVVEVLEGAPRDLSNRRRRTVPELERPGVAWQPHEPVRETFLSACAEIAQSLASQGFRYARSGPHVSRRRGEFRDTVSFQSSRGSIAVYAAVQSSELRLWRSHHRGRGDRDAFLAAGMLQNLTAEETAIAIWDLSDRSARASVLQQIVQAIRRIALPFFDLFEEEVLVGRLAQGPVPSLGPLAAVEWLLAKDQPAVAVAHARARLALDELLRRRVERLVPRYRESPDGGPFTNADEAEDLAYAIVAHELNV